MTLGCNEIGESATELTLRLEQYTHITLPITLSAAGAPIDCTGAALAFEIRRSASDVSALKAGTVTWINRVLGQASVSMYVDLTCGPRETDLASQYFFDCVFTDSLAKKRSVCKGPCIINRGGVR